MAGLGVVACATMAVKLVLAASTLHKALEESVGGSFWDWLSPTVFVWAALAVGLWFERGWARLGMRVFVTINAALLVATPFLLQSIDPEKKLVFPSWINLGTTVWMFWVAWWMKFRYEPQGLPLLTQARVSFYLTFGLLILVIHQIRRLFGMSYLPWHYDPYVIARGRRATWGEIAETIAFPEEYDECWVEVGTIPVPSGEVVVCDPMLLPAVAVEEITPSVDEVPPRAHTVQLQIARLRHPYGLTVLRARILWSDPLDGRLEHRGNVMVDSALICLVDHKKAMSAPDLEAGAYGHKLWRSCRLDGTGGDEMVVFSSAFGDGMYPVFKLMDVYRCFGVYVDMTCRSEDQTTYCLRMRGWAAPKPPGPEEFGFADDDDEDDEELKQDVD